MTFLWMCFFKSQKKDLYKKNKSWIVEVPKSDKILQNQKEPEKADSPWSREKNKEF